jgi:putative flippase GtrA
MAAVPANIVSYTTTLCVSFALNRNFTLHSSAHSLMPAVQFYRLAAVNLVCLVGSTAAIWLLSGIDGSVSSETRDGPICGGLGFLSVRLIVFRQRRERG